MNQIDQQLNYNISVRFLFRRKSIIHSFIDLSRNIFAIKSNSFLLISMSISIYSLE
jgi:hypothetical protein